MPELLKIKESVLVVTTTFSVVVGFAVTHFLSRSAMVRRYNMDHKDPWRRGLFYCSSVTMLVCLALRFLIGSQVHLWLTYVSVPIPLGFPGTMCAFLKDLFFLIAFGIILVQVAWAKDSVQFTRRLTEFFVLVLIWGLATLLIWHDSRFVRFWLPLDLSQLVVTLAGFYSLQKFGRRPYVLPITMLVLSIAYAILFGWDIKWIIERA